MVTQVSSKTLYDQDLCLWAETMANLLRTRQLSQLDREKLIEEIENMSGREKSSLESNLEILLIHLLKWYYQPNKRTNSWYPSILEHRKRIHTAFRKSHSLKRHFDEILPNVYQDSRKMASVETMLDMKVFPLENPFSREQILDPDFPSINEKSE